MTTKEEKITDARLRKIIPRQMKKMLKDMDSEPSAIIIEGSSTEEAIPENTLSYIREWLFRREEDNGSSRS